MNSTRVSELRRERGWTQEQLAERSGVTSRTIQRLEASNDASLETLNLVANAFGVAVKDLFVAIDDGALNTAVGGLDARREHQRSQRAEISRLWRLLYPTVGVAVSMIMTAVITLNDLDSALWIIVGAYWAVGFFAFRALRAVALEPWLDRRFPLTAPR